MPDFSGLPLNINNLWADQREDMSLCRKPDDSHRQAMERPFRRTARHRSPVRFPDNYRVLTLRLRLRL